MRHLLREMPVKVKRGEQEELRRGFKPGHRSNTCERKVGRIEKKEPPTAASF